MCAFRKNRPNDALEHPEYLGRVHCSALALLLDAKTSNMTEARGSCFGRSHRCRFEGVTIDFKNEPERVCGGHVTCLSGESGPRFQICKSHPQRVEGEKLPKG